MHGASRSFIWSILLVTMVLFYAANAIITDLKNRCPLNDRVPCGFGTDNAKNGAFYKFQGVDSEVPFQEIESTDSASARAIQDIYGTTGAANQLYSRLVFDITFMSGLATGCAIEETWDKSTRWVPGGRPQCSLSGACSGDNCYELQGPVPQPFIISASVNNVVVENPAGGHEHIYPFDVLTFRRRQRGRAPNSDLEDDQTSHMYSGDDDRFLGGGTSYSGHIYRDDDNNSADYLPTLCDDDNMNNCNTGDDSDDSLKPCFDIVNRPRFLLSAYGHPYLTGNDDRTCGIRKKAGVDDKCTDNCDRAINPAVSYYPSEPFSMRAIYDAYDGQPTRNGYYGCDLVTASWSGCKFGGSPRDWDNLIEGDDDDDNGSNQATDDDDDDDFDYDDDCRVERGYGTKQDIQGEAVYSSLSAVLQGIRPLQASVYDAISSPGDGSLITPTQSINAQEADEATYKVAATCTFCQSNGGGGSDARARRFFQYEVRPMCSEGSYSNPSDPTRVAWSGSLTIAGNTFDLNLSEELTAITASHTIYDKDTSSLTYGAVATTVVSDTAIYSSFPGFYNGFDTFTWCNRNNGAYAYEFRKNGIIFPYLEQEDNCNGCTSLSETGFGINQQLWYTQITQDNNIYPCTADGRYNGLADGGLQTTSLYLHKSSYDTNQSTIEGFGICSNAISQNHALLCRNTETADTDGTGRIDASPARRAAAFSNIEDALREMASQGASPADINAAYRASDPIGVGSMPYGFEVSPTPNMWINSDNIFAGMATSLKIITDEEGVVIFEDDFDSDSFYHFRLALYVPDSLITLNTDLLALEQFTVASTGSSSLCPLVADAGAGSCQAGQPYERAADATSVCGYGLVRTAFFSSDPYAPENLLYTVRYNFNKCNASPNFLFQFCADSDAACQLVTSSQIQFRLGDDTAVALAQGASVLFYSTADQPSCSAECEVQLQQRLGGSWRTLSTQLLPSCQQLSTPADRGTCDLIYASASSSATSSPTPSATNTPTPSLSIGSSPSSTATRSLSSSITPSSSRDKPSATPTISPSPSAWPLDYSGNYCDTCDLACKCTGDYADASACFSDPCGIGSMLLLGVLVVCLLLACIASCAFIIRRRSKNKAENDT